MKLNIRPSLQGFIRLVLSGVEDAHWAPITNLCNTCRVEFNWIYKLGNPHEWNHYLRNVLNVTGDPKMRFEEPLPKIATQDRLEAMKLFSDVPYVLKKKLYWFYYNDYQAFDYPYPEFAFQ